MGANEKVEATFHPGDSFRPPAEPNAPRCVKCGEQLRVGDTIKARNDPNDPPQHEVCPIEK